MEESAVVQEREYGGNVWACVREPGVCLSVSPGTGNVSVCDTKNREHVCLCHQEPGTRLSVSPGTGNMSVCDTGNTSVSLGITGYEAAAAHGVRHTCV